MTRTADFIAADLGASGGRVILGKWNGANFVLSELQRFSNNGVTIGESLYWNVLEIWSQIEEGLMRYRTLRHDVPAGIAVDGWGVDFGLLDRCGRLLGNPFHYRDKRTVGVAERVFQVVSEEEIFSETGVQSLQINTLFQLYSMLQSDDPQLRCTDLLLTIPDLFLYFLSGEKSIEFTEATTTQMYSVRRVGWAREMLSSLGISVAILPKVTSPGTVVSQVRPAILRKCGLSSTFPVIAAASHDTASAVAAIPNMDENSAFISSGTWSLMGVELERPDTSQSALSLRFTNEGSVEGSVLFLKNITGLWILQQCLAKWRSEGEHYSWNDLISAAFQAPPFQCLFDPNAQVFQAPFDMPEAIRNYCRDTLQTVPQSIGHIARSAFESLSLKYRAVLDSLELLTRRNLRTVRIGGGGSLNVFLSQMTADACEREVVCGPAEASALGNVMLQAVATGHLSGIASGRDAIRQSVQCVSYEPRRSDAWKEAYSRFIKLTVD